MTISYYELMEARQTLFDSVKHLPYFDKYRRDVEDMFDKMVMEINDLKKTVEYEEYELWDREIGPLEDEINRLERDNKKMQNRIFDLETQEEHLHDRIIELQRDLNIERDLNDSLEKEYEAKIKKLEEANDIKRDPYKD